MHGVIIAGAIIVDDSFMRANKILSHESTITSGPHYFSALIDFMFWDILISHTHHLHVGSSII